MFFPPIRMIACTKLILPAINKQQVRAATILKRVHTPPILKKGSDPSGRITQEELDKNAIPQFWDGPSEEFRPDPWYLRYDVVQEDTEIKYPPIKVILMRSMEEYGMKGQIITLPTEEAQKNLLLPGFAIYASPENLSKHADIVIPEDSVSYSSETTQQKLPLMTKVVTPIIMSGDDYSEKWVVEPWHIRVALRTYSGIHLESDECVRIPSDKKVEGPRSSNHGKEFLAYIKINEFEEVPVRCILYQSISPVMTDDTDSYDILNIADVPECPPKAWRFSFNEPLFEEERKALYMLPRSNLPEVISNERRRLAGASEYNITIDEIKDIVKQYKEWKEQRDKELFSN